ncbi:MAG: ComEC/Rec2 family competence protein [Actinomycetota bacterium]
MALALWGGVLLALHLEPAQSLILLVLIILLALFLRRKVRQERKALFALFLIGSALILIRESGERIEATTRAITFEIIARGDSDPLPLRVYGSEVQERSCSLRAESRSLDGRERQLPLRVISQECSLYFGERITGRGRLQASKEKRVAATLLIDEIAERSSPLLWRELDSIRKGYRSLFQGLGDAGSLVPGMVIGDTSLQSEEFDAAMRIAGLSHLTAVSGANFSIVATLVLWLVSLRIRSRRLRIVITAATLLLFTILVRPSPSVLRAGVMAAVVLYGQLRGNQRSTLLALAGAVVLLLLIDPHQGGDAGFALSVLATFGIVTISPRLSEFISSKFSAPKVLAEIISIPLAATFLCTPLIVAISGKLSLASIPLNILASPLVPIVTISGFAALLTSTLSGGVAHFLAWISHLAAWPIASIAPKSYSLPIFEMPFGLLGVALFLLLLALFLYGLFSLIALKKEGGRSRLVLIAAALLSIFITLVPFRPSWQAFQCNVGQGDALLIKTGRASAILIDTGPDPMRVDRCLRIAGIRSISLLVITHFHADHYGGLSGVLRGRKVADWWIAPDSSALTKELVDDMEIEIGKPATLVRSGMRYKVGEVSLEVLWPDGDEVVGPTLRGDGSGQNNRSIALLIEKDGARIFAGGDIEPFAQEEIARRNEISTVDIYKVSHHGSALRSGAFDLELNPMLALISVGERNPYGHPAPEALQALAPALIHRTDLDGSARITWWPLRVK